MVGVTQHELERMLAGRQFYARLGLARAKMKVRFVLRNRFIGIERLVHVDQASSPRSAIEREKQIKRWSRWKKVALIEATNPEWRDLTEAWVRW